MTFNAFDYISFALILVGVLIYRSKPEVDDEQSQVGQGSYAAMTNVTEDEPPESLGY